MKAVGAVTGGKDLGITGAQRAVGGDGATDAQLQPGLLGKACTGGDADGRDHQVRGKGQVAGVYAQPVAGGSDAVHPVAVVQAHPALLEQFAHRFGQLPVQPGQQPHVRLDQVHRQPQVRQGLGHFQGDVAHAQDHRPLRLALAQELLDAPAVFQVLDREHAGQIHALDGRPDRGGAGGNEQPVPGQGKGRAVAAAAVHRARAPVDTFHSVAGAQVDPLLVAEGGGAAHHQVVQFAGRVGDVVGDVAGAVGHVRALFEHRDFEFRVVAASATGRAHAGGVTADDDKSHGLTSSFGGRCGLQGRELRVRVTPGKVNGFGTGVSATKNPPKRADCLSPCAPLAYDGRTPSGDRGNAVPPGSRSAPTRTPVKR